MANPIQIENLNVGTYAWYPPTNFYITQIQGYCDKTSYNPGDTVTFFVSTQVNATAWTLAIYRLGWYGGMGGCLKYTSTSQVGIAQGYYDPATFILHNCPTAIYNATTGLLEAGWASSLTWAIPGNACTGIYVAQFTDAGGHVTYAPFVVKTAAAADYVLSAAFCTNAAYNQWGGQSLYQGSDGTAATKAVKVSFNRPDANGTGTGNLFRWDVNLVKWVESQGYNVSYASDVDLHVGGSAFLANYKAAIFTGHDEYWTYQMRGAVEVALGQGMGLAWMGADAVYWQIRFENDNGGNANRTVVCYRVATNDPQYGVNNTLVTVLWRDAVLNRPENALIGVMFDDVIDNRINVGWTVDSGAGSLPYLIGTGLTPGSTYGTDLIGVEYDKVMAGSPAGLQTIGTTAVLNSIGGADTANTTYYRHPSGALVFAAGSIGWTWALDSYRYAFVSGPLVVPGMQQLLANVMADLIKARGGTQVTTGVSRLNFHR